MRLYTRTVLSADAVARRGRVGCGEDDQARTLLGGAKVARGWMVSDIVSERAKRVGSDVDGALDGEWEFFFYQEGLVIIVENIDLVYPKAC